MIVATIYPPFHEKNILNDFYVDLILKFTSMLDDVLMKI